MMRTFTGWREELGFRWADMDLADLANGICFYIGGLHYQGSDYDAIKALRRSCERQIRDWMVTHPYTWKQTSRNATQIMGEVGPRTRRWRAWAIGQQRRTRLNMAVASVIVGVWASYRLEVRQAVDRVLDELD